MSVFYISRVFSNDWSVLSQCNHIIIYILSFRSIIEATVKCPGVGAFDHLEWTYDGAFEQLFGLGRGEFSKNFPKIQMPGGCPGGGCLSFDLTGT